MADRFSKVTDNLFRGGKPSREDLYSFKENGINKIVSLDEESGEDISDICRELGFEHIIWGLGNGHDPKVFALKKRIIPTLTINGPTYVHCYHGKDRTGMTVAMFRIYNGWDLKDALAEAFRFGMGKGLSKESRDSYYDAVRRYYKEFSDNNNSIDAVTLTRETNSFGPTSPAINDATVNPIQAIEAPPHADIEFSQLSRIAYSKVFCRCRSDKLLNPGIIWRGSISSANKNPIDEDGRLFSANISSSSIIDRFDKPVSKKLIDNILLKDIDVAILRGDQYLIIYPESLINIMEEDDSNYIVDVGTRDNATDYTYSYPGSGSGVGGGMPDGAAGVVVLPFTGPGQI